MWAEKRQQAVAAGGGFWCQGEEGPQVSGETGWDSQCGQLGLQLRQRRDLSVTLEVLCCEMPYCYGIML